MTMLCLCQIGPGCVRKKNCCHNSPGNRNSNQAVLSICLLFARVYQCMQIAWKISYVFSCSASGSAPLGLTQGDEGIGIAGGWDGKDLAAVGAADCPTVSETCLCWDRRNALLGSSQTTSSLYLPASARAAVWGAHVSLATFCSLSSHISPLTSPCEAAIPPPVIPGLPLPLLHVSPEMCTPEPHTLLKMV